MFRAALLIAGAGLAVAQSISSQCSSTLLAVAASPEATCLDLSLLVPLALLNPNTTSVIPTVNNWLIGMCGQSPCNNATPQAVVTNVTSGCSSDLASLGLSTDDPATLATTVEAVYPTVRQVACLKDTSLSTLCATELLSDIQSSTTILSINNIAALITQAMSGKNINIPQNVTCSNCSKAGYIIVSQNYPSLLTSEQATIQSECGSSFTDGQMPSNVQEIASNSTSSSTGGATPLSINSLDAGVAILIAVSFTFVVFA